MQALYLIFFFFFFYKKMFSSQICFFLKNTVLYEQKNKVLEIYFLVFFSLETSIQIRLNGT